MLDKDFKVTIDGSEFKFTIVEELFRDFRQQEIDIADEISTMVAHEFAVANNMQNREDEIKKIIHAQIKRPIDAHLTLIK